MNQIKIEKVKAQLKRARSISVLTGAGISADSGVPTFRGKGGLWKNFRAEELATPEAFDSNPTLVWEWYNMRREKLVAIKPNPAHTALATLEKRCEDFTLITQNVDGLHKKGGSKNTLELHGNIWKVRCTVCGVVEENYDVPIALPPHCNGCGGLLRPHIVWFGEMLEEEVLTEAYSALERCGVLMIIGTSGVVQPAASMALIGKRSGAFVVEVNLENTPSSEVVDETIVGRAAEVVPSLIHD